MKILKERILKDGMALNETVLKVDSFLNHGVDSHLMYEIGTEFKNYFENHRITKIFTIESSGIAPTVMTAMQMNLPMVTQKKHASKKYISEDDHILIIDDFLANGEAALGAIRLVEEAGAKVAGIGIVIEKSFQPGRQLLIEKGYDVYSLARVSKLGAGVIEFVQE